MKRSLLTVAALAATFSVCAMAQAMAQTSQPPSAPSPASSNPAPTGASKIAVIEFQPAVMSTNEGRQALAKIQQKFSPEQAQLKALNEQIDTLKKQLQASGSTLSADERAARLRTIDDKEKSLRRQAQDDQADYQQSLSDAFQGVAQKFVTVMQEYARTHGYGLVLDTSSQQTPVVWASRSADISQAVVNEYNQKSGVEAPAPRPSSSTSHGTTTHRHSATSH